MGAWSHASFGNDDAMDFIEEVREDGEAAIANAFEVVNHLPADVELEAPDACVAIAAAEMVAAALGRPSAELPPAAAELIAKITGEKTLRGLALKAVERVLAASELRDLWAATNDMAAWEAAVRDLAHRLA